MPGYKCSCSATSTGALMFKGSRNTKTKTLNQKLGSGNSTRWLWHKPLCPHAWAQVLVPSYLGASTHAGVKAHTSLCSKVVGILNQRLDSGNSTRLAQAQAFVPSCSGTSTHTPIPGHKHSCPHACILVPTCTLMCILCAHLAHNGDLVYLTILILN